MTKLFEISMNCVSYVWKRPKRPINPLLRLYRKTWMTNSLWAVENWSVYGRSVRTNDDVEGWHNPLNHRAKNGNLSFYYLITLLFEEANEVPMQWQLIKEKNKSATRVSKPMPSNCLCGRLGTIKGREMCTSKLLNECCRLYGPVWTVEWKCVCLFVCLLVFNKCMSCTFVCI